LSGGPLRIGTRGSRLALWQAEAVAGGLRSAGVESQLVVIKTTGDRSQDRSTSDPVPGPVPSEDTKRQFVKEIEDALLAGEVDIAVHSAKDLPVDVPQGLALAACLPREDPRDALVLPSAHAPRDLDAAVAQLSPSATIGTGSVRRAAQLMPLMPGRTFAPVRGNVDTRLQKLDAGQFDALVLACAGLRRLGFERRITTALPIDCCVPAPGQGIVATEIRADDERARVALERIHDAAAGHALAAERTLVLALGGGCELPLGAVSVFSAETLELHAAVAAADGSRIIRQSARGAASRAEDVGRALAATLASAGARELLELG
jgi:hydroxymethylbilane synthase